MYRSEKIEKFRSKLGYFQELYLNYEELYKLYENKTYCLSSSDDEDEIKELDRKFSFYSHLPYEFYNSIEKLHKFLNREKSKNIDDYISSELTKTSEEVQDVLAENLPQCNKNSSIGNEKLKKYANYLSKTIEFLKNRTGEKMKFLDDSLEFVYYDGTKPLNIDSDFTVNLLSEKMRPIFENKNDEMADQMEQLYNDVIIIIILFDIL